DQAAWELFGERSRVADAAGVGAWEGPRAERPGQELIARDVAASAAGGAAETALVEDCDHLDRRRHERRRRRQPRAPGSATADVLLVPHDRRLVLPARVLEDPQVIGVDRALAALVRAERDVDARAAARRRHVQQGGGPGSNPVQVPGIGLVVGVAGLA